MDVSGRIQGLQTADRKLGGRKVRKIDFWTRVQKNDNGCWDWIGPLDANGYGRHGRVLAHRRAYEEMRGQIASDRELDHLCRNRKCVNPDHLDSVSHAENVRRGMCGEVNGRRMRAKKACVRGHAFTPENTGIDHRGHRACRECARGHHRAYYRQDIAKSRRLGRDNMRNRREKEKQS